MKERGYTLQEILVVLAISPILLVAGYQLYLNTFGALVRTTEAERLKLEAGMAMQRISWDLQRSQSISIEDDGHKLLLTRLGGRRIVYELRDSILVRNADVIGAVPLRSIRDLRVASESIAVSAIDKNGSRTLVYVDRPTSRQRFREQTR